MYPVLRKRISELGLADRYVANLGEKIAQLFAQINFIARFRKIAPFQNVAVIVTFIGRKNDSKVFTFNPL